MLFYTIIKGNASNFQLLWECYKADFPSSTPGRSLEDLYLYPLVVWRGTKPYPSFR